MLTTTLPGQISPDALDIPADCRQPRLDERRYLVGGELREWNGPTREVVSPLYVDGEPYVIGSCPALTEAESLEAVAAVERAWDNGRGVWPTMRVEDRIAHVEDFAQRMTAVRDQVVRLMVWEICKPLEDCRAEFDRTVAYLRATVDALKDLDRASSRFVIESGKTLIEGKMNKDGEYSFKKPAGAYKVLFDAGEGHKVEVDGAKIVQ